MNTCTKESLLSLYKAATTFKKFKPWTLLFEDQLFTITDPLTGLMGYCSITGSSGEHFSLTIYLFKSVQRW